MTRQDELGCGCEQATEKTNAPPSGPRPGLGAIPYRLGKHASFMRGMLDQLTSFAPNLGPATLDETDPSVAMVDAFAMVCDVLCFYQERIANEGYLRTATELRSVTELAHQVGYELGSGVAAEADLAFTVEDATGAPETVTIPRGTAVGSVPKRNDLPKTYETLSPLVARAAWNAVRPVLSKAQDVGERWAVLEGAALRIERGDALLFEWQTESKAIDRRPKKRVSDVGFYPAKMAAARQVAGVGTGIVSAVVADSERGQTWVAWKGDAVPAGSHTEISVFRQRAAPYGHNAPDYSTLHPAQAASGAVHAVSEVPLPQYATLYRSRTAAEEEPPERAKLVDGDHVLSLKQTEWDYFALSGNELDLDNQYPKVQAGERALLIDGDLKAVKRIAKVAHGSLARFGMSSKSTKLTFESASPPLSDFSRRSTSVFLEPERLTLARIPDASSVKSNVHVLEQGTPAFPSGKKVLYAGYAAQRVAARVEFTAFDGTTRTLEPGEVVELLGEPVLRADGLLAYRLVDAAGKRGVALGPDSSIQRSRERVGEVATVFKTARLGDGSLEVTLTAPLSREYQRSGLRVLGNVVRASHGETVAAEVLGSGDALAPVQRFTLKKKPLTRLWSGGKVVSTLEVRVDGVLWKEAPSLYGLGERASCYEVHTDADGTTTVVFGADAARLPTGRENVVARYRFGSGVAGAVSAGELSTLKAPVLGLRGVSNPLPAEGGGDPERVENAKVNVPLHLTTLDRIVSLTDYEDFVRSLPGVAKASAVSIWAGASRVVHITVALDGGRTLEDGSALAADLTRAVRDAGGIGQPFRIAGFVPRSFVVRAAVLVDPRYESGPVFAQIRRRLEAMFGFDARSLAQAVTATEVLTMIQAVPGVRAARLAQLRYLDAAQKLKSLTLRGDDVRSVLPARPAAPHPTKGIRAAELLLIAPDQIELVQGLP